MRGVRLVAQRVKKKHVEPVQARARSRGNVAEVGEIRGAAEAEAVDFRVAMQHRDGLKPRAPQLDGAGDGLEFHLRQATVFVVALEDVAEHRAQRGRGVLERVKRNGPVLAVEAEGGHAHGRAAAQHRQARLHRLAPGGGVPGPGGRVMAFVICTNAMRKRKSASCSTAFSSGVVLPRVFSSSIAMVSMVWRAPTMSTCGCCPCSCSIPNWNMADM